MAEPTDLATAIATEVAKQIPIKDVYDDALKPGTRQVGGIIEDITKTIRLVLAPLQITGALQDRFRDFLDQSIRRVPEQDRLPPPPQILGPVLEGIRYEPAESPVSEMFSQLLSASMDRGRVQNAHPAFSLIIKQLSADEAFLLNAMWQFLEKEGRPFRQQFTRDYDRTSGTFGRAKIEIDEIPRELLSYPDNFEFYGQHLYALGIAAFYDRAQERPIFDNGEKGNRGAQIGTRVFKEFRFTDVGLKFMAAVSGK